MIRAITGNREVLYGRFYEGSPLREVLYGRSYEGSPMREVL